MDVLSLTSVSKVREPNLSRFVLCSRVQFMTKRRLRARTDLSSLLRPREQPYDCDAGFDDYKNAWSPKHQRFCCYLRRRACEVKVVNHDKYITVTHLKLVPEYIHMKPTKEQEMVVPKYVPYEVPVDPIKVEVPGPTRYQYHDVKRYKYIEVPDPGKPHVIVKHVPVPVPASPEIIQEKAVMTVHNRHFDCANGCLALEVSMFFKCLANNVRISKQLRDKQFATAVKVSPTGTSAGPSLRKPGAARMSLKDALAHGMVTCIWSRMRLGIIHLQEVTYLPICTT